MQTVDPKDRKILFVFCAHGGAGIINSFLPLVDTEVGDPTLASTLDVYPEALVDQLPGLGFRHVRNLDSATFSYMKEPPPMDGFLQRHGRDMAIFCHGVSSVNHNVAQARSLNGAGANAGRTIMEAMAMRYGGGMPLPNCNMGTDGFIEHGHDDSVPARARHEIITAPMFFATGTHGSRGVVGVPSVGSIERARRIRQQLDRETVFGRTFGKSPRVMRYLEQRSFATEELERADLIERLLLLDPSTVDPKFGLQAGAVVADLYTRFPDLAVHDVQAQLGLGFLLAYHGVATSVTLGFRSDPVITQADGVVTAPIAFDYSHSSHRVTQNVMWGNLAALLDTMITLLKDYDYMGDPSLGKMWDRSLIYVATDFGRTKERPAEAGEWSSGHDLNNGSVLISPLINGNRVYGGVDPKTALTYGFNRETGAPDPASALEEAALYGALCHVLDIDFSGREACPALVRAQSA
ncbi:MAG: hypothetical protein OXR73_24365 [Myxococcales bacterium]|nr:hypothetical protein [Myxococcales bacterium]